MKYNYQDTVICRTKRIVLNTLVTEKYPSFSAIQGNYGIQYLSRWTRAKNCARLTKWLVQRQKRFVVVIYRATHPYRIYKLRQVEFSDTFGERERDIQKRNHCDWRISWNLTGSKAKYPLRDQANGDQMVFFPTSKHWVLLFTPNFLHPISKAFFCKTERLSNGKNLTSFLRLREGNNSLLGRVSRKSLGITW